MRGCAARHSTVAAPARPAAPISKESASTRKRPSGLAKAAAGSAGSSRVAGALASTFWKRTPPAPTLMLARSRVSGAAPDSATPRRPVNTDSGLQLHSRSAMPRKAPPERSASRPLPFHRVPAGYPSASAPRLARSSANPTHAAGAFARRKTRYAAMPRTASRTPGRRRAPVTRPAPATAAARSRCRDWRPFRASRFPRAGRSAAAARPATPSGPRTGRLRSARAPRWRPPRRRASAARAGPAARLPARPPRQDWRAARRAARRARPPRGPPAPAPERAAPVPRRGASAPSRDRFRPGSRRADRKAPRPGIRRARRPPAGRARRALSSGRARVRSRRNSRFALPGRRSGRAYPQPRFAARVLDFHLERARAQRAREGLGVGLGSGDPDDQRAPGVFDALRAHARFALDRRRRARQEKEHVPGCGDAAARAEVLQAAPHLLGGIEDRASFRKALQKERAHFLLGGARRP